MSADSGKFGSASLELQGKEKVYRDKAGIFFIGATENGDGNILYRKYGGGLKDGDYHIVTKSQFGNLIKAWGFSASSETNDAPTIYEVQAPPISKEQAEGLIPAETRLPSGQEVSDKMVDKQIKDAERKEGVIRKTENLKAGANKRSD